ncbi:MAG: hypothetical protein GC160_06800 [Acidobacteria bacterium]|nr:hypothetical protein [Acidobacteriota bacterium]
MALRASRCAVFGLGLMALTLAAPQAHAKCELKKLGGLFSTESFVDSDTGKTIKVKIGDGANPPVTVENYDGKKKVVDYTSYSNAVRNCSFFGSWPNWFAAPKSLAQPRQTTAVPVVTSSSDLDTADLDGDGDLDAVGIRYFQGATVSLANPAGTFPRAGVVYPTGKGPETLLLADLNGDGLQDILVADSGDFAGDNGKLAVLLGLAGGTFSPAQSFAAGVAPSAVTVGDFNGDGKLDAAVASVGSLGAPNLPADAGRVAVLLGNGRGGFGAATLLQAGESPKSIVAADLNADGKLDLVVANRFSDNLSTLTGNGDGTFRAAVQTAVGSRPEFVGSADFNGDGKADVAVLHGETATISMWMNNGSGGLVSGGRYIAGSSIHSFAIASSPDDERPTILSPDGSGGRFLILAANRDGSLVAPPSYNIGGGPGGVASADFDGNQQADLAVAGSGGLKVILNPRIGRTPQATPRLAVAGATTRSTDVAAGDFTGDGAADLVISGNGLSLLAGNGDGTFRAPVNIGPSAPLAIRAADMNGDGRPDLLTVEDSGGAGTAAVLLSGAGGTFTRATYAVGRSPRSVAAADFNGDGRPDLVVGNFGDLSTPAGVSLLLANPSGNYRPATPLDAGLSPAIVEVGDFNGDGKADLAAAGQLAGAPSFFFGLRLLLGNGDGSFRAMPDLETNFGPTDLIASDFNGDGLLDLVMAHCCGATDMSMLLGNGDGTFRVIPFPGGASPSSLAAADFGGEGPVDLAVVGASSTAQDAVATILDFILPSVDHVSAASGSIGEQAADSIISAYGAKLADGTAAAPSPEWPTSLGGASVKVRDSAGVERDAGVAFASPGQVNYHMPAETAIGPATVMIRSGSHQTTTDVEIVRIAPGLFEATPDGLAAAWVIRVKPDGQQLLEPVVQLNTVGQVVAAPIDLSSDTDIVVLQLFGTGLRGRLNLSDVRVLINGVSCSVLYAGPQNQFPGLDQINIELPKSLRGAGVVSVIVEVEGEAANTLQVRIR